MDEEEARESLLPKPIGSVDLTIIDLGPTVAVGCPECDLMSRRVGVGVLPVFINDEMYMYGSISYMECEHNFTCPHLAERCGVLLENLESGGTIPVELLYGLVLDDHEDGDDLADAG